MQCHQNLKKLGRHAATLLVVCSEYCAPSSKLFDLEALTLSFGTAARYRFHADCMESGGGCTRIDWSNAIGNKSRADLAKTTYKAMHESW